MPMRKPRYDTRPGTEASATARLWIVGIICCVQYWLLTSSLEATHAGHGSLALPALIASAICFLLVAGLVITGEMGSHKVEEELRHEDEQEISKSLPEEPRIST